MDLVNKDFKLDNLTMEMVPFVKFQIVRFSRSRSKRSVYGVYAYPEGAKMKRSRDGKILEIWPQIFIGIIESEQGGVGKNKWWDMFPVLSNGQGSYLRSIGKACGREGSAISLLIHCVERNKKRAAKTGVGQAPDRVCPEVMAARMAFEAYMLAFDSFSIDGAEVVSTIVDPQSEMPRDKALSVARKLRDALVGSGLIVTETVDGNWRGVERSREQGKFATDIWQAAETYDYIQRPQAIDLFIEKMPDTANKIKDVIAEEMRKSREAKGVT